MAKSHLALFLVGTAANSGKGAAPLGVELVANSPTDSQGSSSAFLSLVELEKLLVRNVVVTISAIMAVAIVLLLASRQINWRWGAAIIGCSVLVAMATILSGIGTAAAIANWP